MTGVMHSEQLELFPRPSTELPPPKKIAPVLKWAGGKKWLIPHVGPGIWTRLRKTGGCYIEPFVGGGAVAFWLGLGEKMALGDACEPLINLYTQLRDHPGAVAWALSLLCTQGVDEAAYYRVRDMRPTSASQRAAQMIYLVRLGFNGLWRVNKKGDYNVPFGDSSRDTISELFPQHKRKFHEIGKALAGSKLVAGDFAPLVENARDGDVLFVDPPYAESFDSYTKERFRLDDQRRLGNALHNAADRGATVIACNKDCDLIRDIYSWSTIVLVAEARAINSDGAGRGRVSCVLATNAPELIGT